MRQTLVLQLFTDLLKFILNHNLATPSTPGV
jgi:hypothetical protein